MHHDFPFSSLLLITALAAFLPLLSSWLRRLRLSLIVAEILAGMIIGQSGFDLIETGPALDFLATFGFAFLMFLSGLEIDFGAISLGAKKTTGQRLGNPISLAIANFAITVGAAFVSALGMQYLGLIQSPLVMALILSTTSLGIVLPILRERGLAATRYGQALLVTAVVGSGTSSCRPTSRARSMSFCIMFTLNQASSGIFRMNGPRYLIIGEAITLLNKTSAATSRLIPLFSARRTPSLKASIWTARLRFVAIFMVTARPLSPT